MPSRDPRYRQLTIQILIGSQTDQSLLADAEERGTKQLGVVAGIRVADWYLMRRQGIIVASTGTASSTRSSSDSEDIVHPDIGNTTLEDEWPA